MAQLANCKTKKLYTPYFFGPLVVRARSGLIEIRLELRVLQDVRFPSNFVFNLELTKLLY